MTAAHIFVCLIKDGKSYEKIAREDFDNNLELISVWIDYMAAINWIHAPIYLVGCIITYEIEKKKELLLP